MTYCPTCRQPLPEHACAGRHTGLDAFSRRYLCATCPHETWHPMDEHDDLRDHIEAQGKFRAGRGPKPKWMPPPVEMP